MLHDPDWDFLLDKAHCLEEGDIYYRKNYAKTLEKIAKCGPSAFYTGEIAESLVSLVQRRGGILSLEDLEAYHAIPLQPLESWYRGRQILSFPPPSSGPVIIEALNILEGYDLGNHMTGDGVHLLVEAMKWGAAARTELGDPFDPSVNNTNRIQELQRKHYAARIRANISLDHTFDWRHYQPAYDIPESHGTTHISVIDQDGMAVALTSTVNLIFGSRLHDVNTGIILNDEMDDFSVHNNSNAFRLLPSIYNRIQPRKRPLSSCVPTIVMSGDLSTVELVIGAAGGSRIITAVLDACVKLLDWGFTLKDVVEGPRLHHQLLPHIISMEEGYPDTIVHSLRQKGHDIELYDRYNISTAEVQVIRISPDDGRIEAMSDPRKHGKASGY